MPRKKLKKGLKKCLLVRKYILIVYVSLYVLTARSFPKEDLIVRRESETDNTFLDFVIGVISSPLFNCSFLLHYFQDYYMVWPETLNRSPR